MRATRRCLDRSTALMFANVEYVEFAPDSVDSVRDTASDRLALLGSRAFSWFQLPSFGGRGGGGPRPIEGTGDGGGSLYFQPE